MILDIYGEESFALSEKNKLWTPRKCMYTQNVLFSEGVYGPSDIMYELGLWNPTLKKNGFTQQVLFRFYFGCVTLKKSQVVII